MSSGKQVSKCFFNFFPSICAFRFHQITTQKLIRICIRSQPKKKKKKKKDHNTKTYQNLYQISTKKKKKKNGELRNNCYSSTTLFYLVGLNLRLQMFVAMVATCSAHLAIAPDHTQSRTCRPLIAVQLTFI